MFVWVDKFKKIVSCYFKNSTYLLPHEHYSFFGVENYEAIANVI